MPLSLVHDVAIVSDKGEVKGHLTVSVRFMSGKKIYLLLAQFYLLFISHTSLIFDSEINTIMCTCMSIFISFALYYNRGGD